MNEPVKSIAALQGAPSLVIQEQLRAFVGRMRPEARLAGVLEENPSDTGPACEAGYLRSLGDDARYPLFQDLGPGSEACGLDPSGVVSACQAIQRDIEAGCDLVVLSKFGKLEADRSGLAGAFMAAIEARVPILTSVSPKMMEAWERFAAPMFVMLPADPDAIERWWRQARSGR